MTNDYNTRKSNEIFKTLSTCYIMIEEYIKLAYDKALKSESKKANRFFDLFTKFFREMRDKERSEELENLLERDEEILHLSVGTHLLVSNENLSKKIACMVLMPK